MHEKQLPNYEFSYCGRIYLSMTNYGFDFGLHLVLIVGVVVAVCLLLSLHRVLFPFPSSLSNSFHISITAFERALPVVLVEKFSCRYSMSLGERSDICTVSTYDA